MYTMLLLILMLMFSVHVAYLHFLKLGIISVVWIKDDSESSLKQIYQ